MSNYKIIINHYSDGPTGHWNVTFVDNTGTILGNNFGTLDITNGGTQITIGQNIDSYKFKIGGTGPELAGGLFIENYKIDSSLAVEKNTIWRSEEILVSQAQFEAMIALASDGVSRTGFWGSEDYDLFGDNCYSFADVIYDMMGAGAFQRQEVLPSGCAGLRRATGTTVLLAPPY